MAVGVVTEKEDKRTVLVTLQYHYDEGSQDIMITSGLSLNS